MEKILSIEGMTCSHCMMAVKNALEKIKGVRSAEVDLSSKTAAVTLDSPVDNAVLIEAVGKAGYTVNRLV